MVDLTLQGRFAVRVRGMDLDLRPRAWWREQLHAVGDELQERIAESFSGERVAGSSALMANTPEYNRRKELEGFDSRRGHRTNFLQETLDEERLFTVTGISRGGTASIMFLESKLHGLVPYAEYYEAAKVRVGGILQLARSWVRDAERVLRVRAAQAEMRKRRSQVRARVRA